MKLSKAQCKMLSGFIGECWHEWRNVGIILSCKNCEVSQLFPFNKPLDRSFTIWSDIEPLKKALIEKELWDEFFHFALREYASLNDWSINHAAYSKWLYNNDEDGDYRFGSLVANCPAVIEYVEGRNEG